MFGSATGMAEHRANQDLPPDPSESSGRVIGSDELILRERSGEHTVVLRLNRPDRLNAVSLPLYHKLLAALNDAENDSSTRALIVTGEGRAFCVGADLKAHGSGEPTAEERREYVTVGQSAYRRLQTLSKPVVAAVHGHAIGAGLELALSCDFIVAARDAKLRLPEVGLGTFVGGGTVYTLAQRVGLAKAKELIMLGDFFSGDDAAEMGLANVAVPTDQVLPESQTLADKLAEQAPLSLRLAKGALFKAQRLSYEEAMELETEALLRCMETEDWREGIDAFNQKRPPRFTGK